MDASQLNQAFVNLIHLIPVEAAHPFQNPWHQSSFTHMKVLADEAASIRWGFSIWAVTAAVTSNPCRTSPLLRWLLRSPPKAPIQQAPPPGIAVFHFPSRLHGSTDESTKIYQAEACWKVALPHTSSLCERFSTEQFS